MKRLLLFLFLMLNLNLNCFAQDQNTFTVAIDANVENANDPKEKEILALWTAYILENPDFEISLAELRGYIPNGEHHTEFRYVIGGLVCKKVFEKHRMKGVIDGLRTVDTDEDFFAFIEEKLG
ncbi:MAG: hypothetical protein AB8B65_13665, partial [Kordia sp.]|uniref:hypothetical protein n=1 Tax=Kordia sp. TaxID=1965332 RepID=UPI00385CF809